MKRTEKGATFRVAVIPVTLRSYQYRLAHDACHRAALAWNHGVEALRQFWDDQSRDPSIKEMRHLLASGDPKVLELHAHTKQAIVDDLLDAVQTARKNAGAGRKARMPWREKRYRPLSFTRNYGWKADTDNRILWLSLGRGRPRLQLPLPRVVDSSTGDVVSAERWGEILLCWDSDARRWSLHVAYRASKAVPTLNPENVMAIDEGIINPMTAVTETDAAYEVTIINGRHARSVKHRRNTAVADLRKKMSRCTRGSRQWKKYNRALKRANAAAQASLRNVDHQVSRKIANLAIKHDTGTIAVGDVRGIEKNTRKAEKRRAGRHQRRRLSQWSRGRQERYLSEKTGVEPGHINESHSSKTCPACLTRNLPKGRHYRCTTCGFTAHRDAVGALNILQRAKHGNYVAIDPHKPVRVTYLRATPLRGKAPSKAQNRASEHLLDVAESSLTLLRDHPGSAGLVEPSGSKAA